MSAKAKSFEPMTEMLLSDEGRKERELRIVTETVRDMIDQVCEFTPTDTDEGLNARRARLVQVLNAMLLSGGITDQEIYHIVGAIAAYRALNVVRVGPFDLLQDGVARLAQINDFSRDNTLKELAEIERELSGEGVPMPA